MCARDTRGALLAGGLHRGCEDLGGSMMMWRRGAGRRGAGFMAGFAVVSWCRGRGVSRGMSARGARDLGTWNFYSSGFTLPCLRDNDARFEASGRGVSEVGRVGVIRALEGGGAGGEGGCWAHCAGLHAAASLEKHNWGGLAGIMGKESRSRGGFSIFSPPAGAVSQSGLGPSR